jgi:hypothetical protein
VVPGFAVGIVEAGAAAAFGAEEEAGEAEDVGEGEDEPGVFGNDVGGEEIDFGEFVGDGASVDAAVGVEVVEAVLHLRRGFDLDADEAWADIRREAVVVGVVGLGSAGLAVVTRASVVVIPAVVILEIVILAVVILAVKVLASVILAIEDDVVAVAVAEGFGDAKAAAGGGEGKGELGDFAAAFGGELAVEWGFGVRRWCGRSLGETRFASTESGLRFAHEILVWLNFGRRKVAGKSERRSPEGLRQSLSYITIIPHFHE